MIKLLSNFQPLTNLFSLSTVIIYRMGNIDFEEMLSHKSKGKEELATGSCFLGAWVHEWGV